MGTGGNSVREPTKQRPCDRESDEGGCVRLLGSLWQNPKTLALRRLFLVVVEIGSRRWLRALELELWS